MNEFSAATLRPLRWLGQQGTRGVAVAMLSATLLPAFLPDIGDYFRPFLGEAVFALLTIAFVRLQPAAMQHHLRHPGVPLAACLWTMFAIPLLSALACQWLMIDELAPQIYLALMLQAIASPMTATPALAMLLGLDATLVLLAMVISTAMVPFTAALFSHFFIAGELTLAPSTLGLRLFFLLTGSAALGLALRHLLGVRRVAELTPELDGINIFVLFIFAAAIMGGVLPTLFERPMTVLLLTTVVFMVFFGLALLSTLLFLHRGRGTAIALGFMCSQRNMGIMLAATATAVPEQVWLYCALAQLPIYIGPMLLAPLVRRFILDDRYKT